MEDNKVGRPMKYTIEEFNTKVAEYFNMCDSTEIGIKVITNEISVPYYKPYTITGLCLYLDISRETLNNYEAIPEFLDTIKKAKNKIENYVEENSLMGRLNPTVSIFNLKNNFGWKDKTEVDNNIGNKDDKPFNVNLSNLTIDQLKELIKDEDKGTD